VILDLELGGLNMGGNKNRNMKKGIMSEEALI
jgi:hypothetical protein